MRSRKGIEAAAQKIANLVLSERLDPQQAHAVFSALKIIFESLKFSETIEAEYKLQETRWRFRRCARRTRDCTSAWPSSESHRRSR